jgi:hypothetical protein
LRKISYVASGSMCASLDRPLVTVDYSSG